MFLFVFQDRIGSKAESLKMLKPPDERGSVTSTVITTESEGIPDWATKAGCNMSEG
jgi:hypothetical protein